LKLARKNAYIKKSKAKVATGGLSSEDKGIMRDVFGEGENVTATTADFDTEELKTYIKNKIDFAVDEIKSEIGREIERILETVDANHIATMDQLKELIPKAEKAEKK
jgi:hypothetical protein